MHGALKAGLEAMGLSLYVEEQYRLPQLNAVSVPDGIDEAAVRKHLLQNFNLEIGAGLGALAGKVWRIGLMGASARPDRVLLCLEALEDALAKQQFALPAGAGRRAAEALLG
jgi:alanine-glyoxylate transaminase/serine-glyoxylate transaminase/serine-pyruvate transaminase